MDFEESAVPAACPGIDAHRQEWGGVGTVGKGLTRGHRPAPTPPAPSGRRSSAPRRARSRSGSARTRPAPSSGETRRDTQRGLQTDRFVSRVEGQSPWPCTSITSNLFVNRHYIRIVSGGLVNTKLSHFSVKIHVYHRPSLWIRWAIKNTHL